MSSIQKFSSKRKFREIRLSEYRALRKGVNELSPRTYHTYRPIWLQLDVEDLHLLPLRSYKFSEKRWSEIHT